MVIRTNVCHAISMATHALKQLVDHHLNEHYRAVLVLAQLLLTYLSPSGVRGR